MIKEAVLLRKPDDHMTLKSWIQSPRVAILKENLISRANEPVKSYPNTLQRLAKYFWYTEYNKNIIEVADELEQRTDITVVCITDERKQPIGIIKRDKLFLFLGKRFGRDVMSKKTAGETSETVNIYAGERNILVVLEQLRNQNGKDENAGEKKQIEQNEYIVLVDSQGTFSGMLSLQDAANYLVEMTNDDIEQASLLQERLLASADDIKKFDVNVDAWCSSAKGVGGDFYFIKKINENQFFASLCDVSGKGVTAALVVSIVWGFLQSYDMQKGLKDLLVNLNVSIINSFHMEKYLTGFFLIYDAGSRMLRVADMGHAHVVFLRKGKKVSIQKSRVNLPIGIELSIEPSVYSFPVEKGDALLIYSDGISEQDNPSGEEFGEKRLTSLLQESMVKNKSFSEILPKCLEDYRLNTPQHDDMTFLLFRF